MHQQWMKHLEVSIILLAVCNLPCGGNGIKIKQILIEYAQKGLVAGVGEVCRNDEDCASKHTHCPYGICKCVEGFIADRDVCKQVCMGCQGGNECNIEHTQCVNNKCECDYGYTLTEGICKKEDLLANSLGTSCLTSSQCQGSHVVCGASGKCECDRLFTQVIDRCLPEDNYQGPCESSFQCVSLGQCCNETLTCECDQGKVFDYVSSQQCIEEIGFNDGCETDLQCNYLNGKCGNGTCGCQDNYGLDVSGEYCVAELETVEIDLELPDLTYTDDLNINGTQAFLDVQDTVEAVLGGVQTQLLGAGVDVIDLSLDSFSGMASGSGSVMKLVLMSRSTQLHPTHEIKSRRTVRVKRSVVTQRMQMEIAKAVKRILSKRIL